MVLVQTILGNLELNLFLELREHCNHMRNKCFLYSHRSLTVNSSSDFSIVKSKVGMGVSSLNLTVCPLLINHPALGSDRKLVFTFYYALFNRFIALTF